MNTDTPRTQHAADRGSSGLELAEQLERELNQSKRLLTDCELHNEILIHKLNHSETPNSSNLNQWRDIAKRLAIYGGGLGMYDAAEYNAAIDEYKRMAAMPNEKS